MMDPLVVGVPFITFFPMLVVATVLGGVWGGVSALLIGTLVGTYAWVPPLLSFQVTLNSVATALSFLLSGGIVVGAIHFVNEAVRALSRSEARSAMIAKEMQHRIKNVLQLVQSISNMTARHATSPEEYRDHLNDRIRALAQALEAPRSAPHLPVDLQGLLLGLLKPFGIPHFTIAGPPVGVADETISMLALAVHELATNAVKYGALSVPNGKISVQWHLKDGFADLEWQERDGPKVTPPVREGFGSKLLKAALVKEHGSSTLTYEPDGVRRLLRFQIEPLAFGDTAASNSPSDGEGASQG